MKGTSWSSTVVVTFFAAVFLLHTEQSQATLRINNVVISQAAGAEYNSLTNNGNDALRVEIFVKMMNANGEEFKFDDVTHASQHFDMRIEAINVMNEIENQTIKFLPGSKMPPPGWVQLGGQPFYYKPGPGLTPTQAIRKIEDGVTGGECIGQLDACVMIAWRRTLGDAEINRQWTGKNLVKIDNEILAYVPPTDQTQRIPGDALFMDNYDYPNSAGVWQGENLLYMGNDKFSGQEVYNKTEAQIRAILYIHYFADTGNEILPGQRVAKIKFTEHKRPKILTKK